MDRIPERVDSTFRFVLLAARRAEQLMRGARPRVDAGSPKPTRIALREISDDLVSWRELVDFNAVERHDELLRLAEGEKAIRSQRAAGARAGGN